MQGKATVAGHPVHPILVTFPIGCYVAAIVSDIVSIWAGTAFWATMSTYLILFGLFGSLFAAFFGIVDYLSAPMSEAARGIANWHMTLIAATILVFGTAFAIRAFDHTSEFGYALTALGIVVLAVAGIFGGSLAHRHLVGSSEGDLREVRLTADETDLSPLERVTSEREIARSSRKGTI